MELIKIESPKTDLMSGTLNEQECDDLFNRLCNVLEAKQEDMPKLLKENFKEEYEQALMEEDSPAAAMIAVGGLFVAILIKKLVDFIRNKYRLTVKRIYSQSKELNDIYTKVEDMLKNDKMARFKHRNDRVDYELEKLVMKDKATSKIYYIKLDDLAYNSDFFIKQINDLMAYVASMNKKDKTATITSKTDDIMKMIQESFMGNHGFVVTCEPLLRIEKIKNAKLEEAVMEYKDWVSLIYETIYYYNENIAAQLSYLQVLEQAYHKLLTTYGKDKEAKASIDKIFTQLIKNMTLSMDFNTKVMTILEEMIKFYAEELRKVYEIIRS